MIIKNFGRNVIFEPKHFYRPKNEKEVLEILERHKKRQIRTAGSFHAWNPGIVSNDAFVEISNLNQIKISEDKSFVTVGGGCKLKKLIKVLAKNNLTVPAMGGIMQQTVAGLASTATHGTGRSSFSHYIQQIRVAAYDNLGNAKIFEFDSGEKLLAARASMGCMGIILSLKIPCLTRYWILERAKNFKTLDEVLGQESEWALQQTAIIPHLWHFASFQRKLINDPGATEKIRSGFLRFYDFLSVEITLHLFLKFILFLNNKNFIIKYYKTILPKFLSESVQVNIDFKALTLHTKHHYYFKHLETEVFIPEDKIKQAFEIIREITDFFARTVKKLTPKLEQKLKEHDLFNLLDNANGSYVLHYPPFIRKVLPDDTLISMTSNRQAYYAIGFFTYHNENQREEYFRYVEVLTKILAKFFDARLHWGKYFPLKNRDIVDKYPDLEKFKNICKELDPNGVFRNDFIKEALGFNKY